MPVKHRHFSLLAMLMLAAGAAQAEVDPTNRALTLAADLPAGALKDQLLNCASGPFYPTEFAIAHRGAPLGYPEHSREGYVAAANMGAGIIECDVTFTKDLELVCRHSQCDLASSTNILQTELANTCRQPFTPAQQGAPASAQCCTSDITLAEFKTLCARPDVKNSQATSVDGFLAPLDSP
ncbi:MAG TPA: glycerophosphodiester phosphodiesterase, partial [Gammaproteobacteria bacterium]|nr:glycerophosphodiester phosphodiesterase [Gammaproteobacteria bacterium]